MKRFASLLLAMAMLLCLCACKGGTESEKKSLQVGYGRVNITPSYSVPLAGYGNTSMRMNQSMIDYIYATCIAVTDENDSTVLLITIDIIAVPVSLLDSLRAAITEATGVPADRIIAQGTHTHSGPDPWSGETVMSKYKMELVANVAKAAADAMADRSPATMETGFGHTEGLSFVRHYTMDVPGIYGDNLTKPDGATLTGHTSEPDNEIQLICFRRAAEDKKDILAVNWQTHAKLNSGGETDEGRANRPMLSADYIGGSRDYIEKNSDYLYAFYLGAAGNLNANSKIVSENVSTECKEYSKLLGDSILEGAKTLAPVEGTQVKSTQKIYEAAIDGSENHLLAAAKEVHQIWSQTNDYAAAMVVAEGTDIKSPYHAGSIINRANNAGTVRKMELNAVTIGNVGFVTAPYEMFDTNGMFIKENSPFETTFVMTCANGHNDYIAAEYAFENGGTYEVHNRSFAKGTAEDLANTYVDMLKSLK